MQVILKLKDTEVLIPQQRSATYSGNIPLAQAAAELQYDFNFHSF